MSSISFSDVPVGVKQSIFSDLDTKTLLSARHVCKEWKDVIDKAKNIWKARCQETFNFSSDSPLIDWQQFFFQTYRNWFEGRCVSRKIGKESPLDRLNLEGGQLFNFTNCQYSEIDSFSPLVANINLYNEQIQNFPNFIEDSINGKKLSSLSSLEDKIEVFKNSRYPYYAFSSKWVVMLFSQTTTHISNYFLCVFNRQTQELYHVEKSPFPYCDTIACNDTSIALLSGDRNDYHLCIIQIETKKRSSTPFPKALYPDISFEFIKILPNGLILLIPNWSLNPYKWLLDHNHPSEVKRLGEDLSSEESRNWIVPVAVDGNRLAIFNKDYVEIRNTNLPATTSQKVLLKDLDGYRIDCALYKDRLAISYLGKGYYIRIYDLTKNTYFELKITTLARHLLMDQSQLVMINPGKTEITVLNFLSHDEASQPTQPLSEPGLFTERTKTILKTIALTTLIALNIFSLIIIGTHGAIMSEQVQALSVYLSLGLVWSSTTIGFIVSFEAYALAIHKWYLKFRYPDHPRGGQLQVRRLTT